MKIFLVGLPGSGKSTIGKKLAKALNFKFIDIDEEICKVEGTTIENIFKIKKENYFRKVENETLVKIAAIDEDAIISTGGGTPSHFNNMDIINENGTSIYFNIPLDVIVARLKAEKKNKRPMIDGKSTEEILNYIQLKYKERNPFYSKAKIEYRHKDLKVDWVIAKLKEQKLIN